MVVKADNQNTVAAILWMMTAGLLFVAVTVSVRYLGSDMPAVEAAFIRYLFGLVLLIPVFMRIRWRAISRKNHGLYLCRGMAHGMAVMLWFYAMARIPIADVTAIGYTTPIFTAVGAIVFFKERIQKRRLLAIVIGFVGTLIILRPGFQVIEAGALAQLFAAPCFAISFLLAKKLTREQGAGEILAMLSIFCTLALLPGALLQWQTPTFSELAWLLLVAAFATAGHYALTKAFAHAPLTVTQPFAFLQLVWAILFGILLFGETPDIWVVVGAAVIVGAVTYISHREAVSRRNLVQSTPSQPT
jgi:drug/metabolite transporter (DMT)-like permease